MEVISNQDLIESVTSVIDSVWFCTSPINDIKDKDGKITDNSISINEFINRVIAGYVNKNDIYLRYKIDSTDADTFPRLYGLMEYNKIPKLDYPINYTSDSILKFNKEDHYIGEYYASDAIVTSKIIFPKELVSRGYNTAIVYQNEPEEEITENTQSLPWKYIITLDTSENNIDRVTNNIIQFKNDIAESEEVFTHIHESNYSNPHADQISRISTTTETSNITSFSEFNNLVTNTNAIVIKNYLVSEDYSVVYLGDQLDPDSIDDSLWSR